MAYGNIIGLTMLTDFDIMWSHVKAIIIEMLDTDEKLHDEEFFKQYCSAFEQLAQIIERDANSIAHEKLEDTMDYLNRLRSKFDKEKDVLQEKIAQERIKAMTHSAYTIQEKLLPNNFNKQS
jgi:hypothetical protein